LLLKFAYQDFLEDRKFKNTTKANIRNYEIILGEFINYCISSEILNVEDITTSHVRQYLSDCQQKKGNQAGTINTKLLRIRAFFNYCVESEYIKSNPANKIKRLKEDVKINVFTDEQIQQMLAYYRRLKTRDKSYFAYRDYMIIVTLLGSGLRRSEIVDLKWSDVDFKNLSISAFGKNRIKESIPITEKLAKELAAYKVFCERHFKNLSEYVFVNRKNQKMTENALTVKADYFFPKIAGLKFPRRTLLILLFFLLEPLFP